MTHTSPIAIINLSTGEIKTTSTPDELLRAYLGGRGLNMAYLRHYLRQHGDPRSVDALSPENPLIVGAGLMTGTISPNAARFNVSARSPESGILGDANCGGFFAAAMRKAGFDRLIILGRAEKPSYLLIEDGQISVHAADGLWGLNAIEAQNQLKARHGSGTVSAVIGPSGENQVRMAAIMTGQKNAAGRGGMGAVMGSKNLKAIVARGGTVIEVAQKETLRALRLKQQEELKSSKVVQVLGKVGTPLLYEVSNRLGAIRTRNSQDNFFEETLNGEEVEKFSDKMLACTSCVVHCRHRNTLGGEGPEYSTLVLLGANIGIAPTDQVIQLNNLVNDLGLDASSTGTIIGWAMELYQRGLIDDSLTGKPLVWGDYETVYALIEDIAHRRGFGNILAESTQAARYFPQAALDYLIAVKNLPQSDPHDVRYFKGFALGIAVASRGADHLRNRPTLEVFKLPDEARANVYGRANDPDPTGYKDKGLIVAYGDDIYAVADCLGVCRFVTRGFNSPHLLGYQDFCDSVAAATGLEYTPASLRDVGRRTLDTERLINAGFGLTRADDTLPKRYFDDPMPARKTKGHHVDREQFQLMLDEYYAERGWDADGRVSAERIAEIDGLNDVIAGCS
ncbi:MAG TPA: aldehyde ferredoxin oxidoreductase family protein [Anaerolineales bacterium]|nr:aldehyde ferredoxin oxidoreductase family protein [Anaerolineales bacterium]HQX18090.1 aldehyde ferredoxin oxidoreductase family protein [Anaerolineales bacterium]